MNADHFRYLDTLRETGVTNMYGAGSWLENAFDMDRDEARNVLLAWMDTFDPEKAPEERAASIKAKP